MLCAITRGLGTQIVTLPGVPCGLPGVSGLPLQGYPVNIWLYDAAMKSFWTRLLQRLESAVKNMQLDQRQRGAQACGARVQRGAVRNVLESNVHVINPGFSPHPSILSVDVQ